MRKERVFFLLSKVVLIAKRRGEAFVYKSHIFVRRLSVGRKSRSRRGAGGRKTFSQLGHWKGRRADREVPFVHSPFQADATLKENHKIISRPRRGKQHLV